MCKLYNYSSGDAELGLIEWLEMGSRQKELVFVQDEEELVMLTELSLLYRSEISTWINSRLIMDNEIDIIYDFKKNPVSVDGKILNNPKSVIRKKSCHFLMTAIRKIALYILDS